MNKLREMHLPASSSESKDLIDIRTERTEWFAGNISPVHKGWYERRASASGLRRIGERLAVQFWDGKHWRELVSASSMPQLKLRHVYSDWRGLANPPQASGGEDGLDLDEKRLLRAEKYHYVDGLNVAYWSGTGRPDLNIVLLLAIELLSRSMKFHVIFDANAERLFQINAVYKTLMSKFPKYFSSVSGGIRADDFLLSRADSTDGYIISNDQFKDYYNRYSWLKNDSSRLLKGAALGDGSLVVPTLLDAALDSEGLKLFDKFCRLASTE